MKRARLIYNPTSGREEIKKRLSYILDRLEGMGYETSAFQTKKKGDAVNESKRASNQDYDLIVVAGGDGTLNEVISGISTVNNRPKIGLLPLGTSNDFANALKIPRKVDKALDIIEMGAVVEIDVGRVNNEYFVNVAGGGSLTELTYEVPSKLKTMLGQTAYFMKGIEKLPQFRPIQARIKTDSEVIEDEIMLFLVTNTTVVGGFDKISPFSKYDDGLFDVLVLKKCNVGDLIRILSLLNWGEHIQDPKIMHFKTKKFEIETNDHLQLNIDGEFGGTGNSKFEILEKHIKIIK